MKVIHKYKLDGSVLNMSGFGDIFQLTMPANAEILTVQEQNGTGTIWAAHDEGDVIEQRSFVLQPTGASFDASNLTYIGTYQVHNGSIVLHLFEVLN